MSMPLFHESDPQSFNATVTWVPQDKGEDFMVDVGQSAQWCQPMADATVAVGDVVRVSKSGGTYLFAGVVAHAPAAPPGDTSDSSSSSSSDSDGSTS